MKDFKLSKRNAVLSIVLIVAIVLLGIFGVVGGSRSAQAGPSTPSNIETRNCSSPQIVTLYTAIITQSSRGPVVANNLTGPYCTLVDIQWSLSTSGTAANGVTLAWQVSNDAGTWTTASVITSGITTTAANDFQEMANFGQYSSVYATLTSTAQVTLTAIGLFK